MRIRISLETTTRMNVQPELKRKLVSLQYACAFDEKIPQRSTFTDYLKRLTMLHSVSIRMRICENATNHKDEIIWKFKGS